MRYGDTIELADGSEIYKASGEMYSGWLRHNRDKTLWTLYETLEEATDSVSQGIKDWEYDDRFEIFEKEVIEHWLDTGEDVELPPEESPVHAIETNLLKVLRSALDLAKTRRAMLMTAIEGIPQVLTNTIDDLEYHIHELENSIQISWHIEDVMMRMSDPDIEAARSILGGLKDAHDANIGINWEVIDAALSDAGHGLRGEV